MGERNFFHLLLVLFVAVSLATILYDLGTDDKTTLAILRYSDVSATQRWYIKSLPA